MTHPSPKWFRKAKRSLHAWFCMVNGNKSALLLCPRPGRRFFLREIVVRSEGVRREHEALRGNHLRGIFSLRVVNFLEERILRRLFRGDRVPGLQEVDQDLGRGTQ